MSQEIRARCRPWSSSKEAPEFKVTGLVDAFFRIKGPGLYHAEYCGKAQTRGHLTG
jgi:hypothetical protein